MVDLAATVKQIRDTLVDELGDDLAALYLFGSAARGQYVPGSSDLDLLLIVAPPMPLPAARAAFRPLWERHAAVLGHGPLVATPDDLALHMELFPSFHRVLVREARRFHGPPVLERLPPPAAPDPLEDPAYLAARAITDATALTPTALPPEQAQRLNKLVNRRARRFAGITSPEPLTPQAALLAIQARLREWARELPQFDWHGEPPAGEVPDLLPGCLAFYRWEKHLITVLERVDEETLSGVDWEEVGAAAEELHARFGLATPWQLRLAASAHWVDSLFFGGFEHVWGADILGDLEADEKKLLRRLARVGSEQRVEKVPLNYLVIEKQAISKLIHDTQNVLLNAGLRAELFARLSGRDFDLPDWDPPGREVPQPERVNAAWARWREVTAYYARLWRAAS